MRVRDHKGGKGTPPRKPGADEISLWQDHVRDARPLPPGRKKVEKIPPPEKTKRRTEKPQAPVSRVQEKPRTSRELDRTTAEKLRRGKMEIDRTVDLHGLTADAARARLADTLRRAYGDGLRLVLVITGKGGQEGHVGVLKREAPLWLQAPPFADIVLRTVPARPEHGGGGALYVLLRRQR